MTSVFFLLLSLHPPETHAFWIWTPETNKWINPKFAVQETPKDQLQYALEFYHGGDLKAAMKEFRKLIKHYPRAREAAEAQYYIARCFEEQDQFFEAFKQYQIAIEKYPFAERSGEMIKRQYAIGNQVMDGKVKKNKLIHTIVGGDYNVIEIFRKVIKNAPYGEYAAVAQYKIGLYLQEKKMYQEARDEFEKTVNDYPESEWAKAAKYRIALSDARRSAGAQYDQKVTEAAIQELQDFVKEHPGAELSRAARGEIHQLREKEAENNFLIAGFYEKQKRFKAAKLYYTTIVEQYKNTSWASKALERLRDL